MMPLEISPAELRTLLDEISKLTASYLESLDSRPIVRNSTAAEMESCFAGDPPAKGLKADALQQLPTLIDNSRAQNGRFFGYVLGSGDPVGAAADLLASALNQNVTAWRSSPAGVTIEKTVIRWLAESIGCRGFQGSLTGGGSSANLMGLAMAREAKLLQAGDDATGFQALERRRHSGLDLPSLEPSHLSRCRRGSNPSRNWDENRNPRFAADLTCLVPLASEVFGDEDGRRKHRRE